MPFVRGRIVPEMESTGRLKKCLDVLLWGDDWQNHNLKDLDDIEILRYYLASIHPTFCAIRLIVPLADTSTAETLGRLNIGFVAVKISDPTPEVLEIVGQNELASAVQTALARDVDVLVVKNLGWLPYAEEVEDLGLFLTETSFLKHYCEMFVRGHEVPWAFSCKIWNQTWNGFYHFAERTTFGAGLDFLYTANKKKINADAQETGRSLIHNRLPNICFTRDRLLFYEIQKLVARRAKWKRQEFVFEVSYYLNFYYPLIYGGFDHIALLVNQSLQLGLAEKNVGATYQSFLEALKAKNAALHSIFTEPKFVEFLNRIAYLRNYASHRGSLAPGKLLEKPDKEMSDDEVDEMITAAKMDYLVLCAPEGELRENIRQMLRTNIRIEHYQKVGNPVNGVLFIEIEGKPAYIRPTNDTYWNFETFLRFMNRVLAELTMLL